MDQYNFIYTLYLVITIAVCTYCSWLIAGKKAVDAIAILITLGILSSVKINSIEILPSLPLYTTNIPILGYQYQATVGLSVPFIGFLIGIFHQTKEYRVASWFFLLQQALMFPIGILYTIAILSIS